MGNKKPGKIKSGTWVTREMATSKAYWALNSTAKGLLLVFLLKRDMDKQHNVLNRRSITVTYLELENLFGKRINGKSDGIPRSNIARAINDLLAKGFIEIIHRGGGYQKDKTVYGLTVDWQWWVPGQVVRKKDPGKRASRTMFKKKSQPPQTEPYTPSLPKPKIASMGSTMIPFPKS
ncbi:MAG: hypothetical protein RBS82_11180 [Syntrophales bacterium]|nr:hypothetical protein [Syntrophales bacterium]